MAENPVAESPVAEAPVPVDAGALDAVPVSAGALDAGAAPAALVLTGGRSYRLTVLNVGLACCAVEAVVAALGDSEVPGTLPLAGPSEPVDVLLVSGTVTDKLAPLVRRLYDSLPGPVRVVSFGACANSGGPYWDSYSVTQGVHLVVPVDLWVPGCPPRPEALLAALGDLAAADQPGRPLQEPLTPRVTGPSDLQARPLDTPLDAP